MFRRFLRWCAHALVPWDKTAGYAVPHLLVACFVGGILALSGVFAVHKLEHVVGGYSPRHDHLPPFSQAAGGAYAPASYSLDRFVVRLHDQDGSYSCVGQTWATMTEIQAKERGLPVPLSSGFIFNLINGGYDRPTSYDDAANVLTNYGDAPLASFSADGQTFDYGWYPSASAFADAARFRIRSWSSVSLSDRYTIEVLIEQGHPLGFIAPWFDSWADDWSGSVLGYPQGGFRWWHSTTIVGYTPTGVEMLNSYRWGANQRAIVPWNVLASMGSYAGGGAGLVYDQPAMPYPPPPKPKLFPAKKWAGYTHKHHLKTIRYKDHGKLVHGASLWWKFGPSKAGPVISREQYYPRAKGRRYGFMTQRFGAERLTWWPQKPAWIKWQRVRRIT